MKEKIKAIIEAMDDDDKIALWNESCRECNHCDDVIYSMDEFDEIVDGYSPLDIVRKTYYSRNFDPNSAYFYFNGYANLVSLDYPDAEKSPLYLDDLVDRIMRHENAFGNDEIAAVLNDEDDDEDDETEA